PALRRAEPARARAARDPPPARPAPPRAATRRRRAREHRARRARRHGRAHRRARGRPPRRGARRDRARGAAGRFAAVRSPERLPDAPHRRGDGRRDAPPRRARARRDRAPRAGRAPRARGAARGSRPDRVKEHTRERMPPPSRPRLGFCSISALDRPLAAAAALAAAAGLDGLEVTARPPHLDPAAPDAAIRDAGRAVRDAGVDVIAYGSYVGRPDGLGPEPARRAVAIAAALETPLLRVWADHVPGEADHGFARIVETLRSACEAAADRGITVVVERHIGSFADTPERIERLFDAVGHEALALNYQVLDALPQRDAA